MGKILEISLDALKEQAEAIQTEQPDIDADTAYGRALQHLARLQAEGYSVSPFEATILEKIGQLSQNGRPVPTKRLSTELYGMEAWSVWYHCSKLRKRGLVNNIGKSGWVIAA